MAEVNAALRKAIADLKATIPPFKILPRLPAEQMEAAILVFLENPPRCQGAEGPCENLGKLSRQNTAYSDDESNWDTLCASCQERLDELWQERWDEYYAGCL